MMGYFDEDILGSALTDSDVQDMACRQFGVSLVIGFALLVVAGLTVASSSREASFEVSGWRQHSVVIRAEAPRLEMAQPALNAPTRG